MPTKSRSKGNKAAAKLSAANTSKNNAASSQETQPAATVQDGRKVNLFAKIFQPGSMLTPTESLTAVHWIRQILAILTGILFGALRLTGYPPVMAFFAVSYTAPFTLLSSIRQLDLEEITDAGSIQTEGFFPATALFYLSWIISYTIFLPAAT